jgi:CRP/FNR family cyclic AMP-dependent transcriptional regulator
MKKILLIEDNDHIRENTAEILELANYKVIVAANGKIGVEKALQEIPDLIICDIMMPVLDGYGVLHAVHKNDAIKNTPFIFLTAKTERNDFRKGMELGADDYITKPFEGTELLNAVDSRLKKIDLLKQQLAPGIQGLEQLVNISLRKNALHSLGHSGDTNTYKKKEIIFSEGNHAHSLFYVISGKVKTYKTNDAGKELVTELNAAGDFIGFVPLLEDSVYKDSAEALEPTELSIIPKKDFEDLLNSNPEVAKQLIRLLAKNISYKEEMLLSLAYNSLRKKVAESLLILQKKYQHADEENFSIDISRENLASIAGTATESLIRTLSDFKSEKLVEITGGNITIINKKKLEGLAN